MTQKTRTLLTATLLLTTLNAEETLQDITVVSANKTEQSIQNTTSNITVISTEEIEENGYQSVAQALSGQSGMLISRSGGAGQITSVFTRGMDSGQTLVLLDGMRLNDPSTPNGAAHLEMLSTANIKQIEIIKGGQSSVWGSNASAGVINIITKQPKEGTHGSATIGYGRYNTKEASADIAYKDEKLTLQAMGSYFKTDGFSARSPRDAEEDGFKNKSANLKLGYAFDHNNKVNLSFNTIDTQMQYDGLDASFMPDPNDNRSYLTSDQKNYMIDYRFSLNDYSAILSASKGKYTRKDYANGTTPPTLYKAETLEYSLINAYRYSMGKIVLGLEAKELKDKQNISSYSSYKNKSVYLSNVYNINETTMLETNLRYDDYDAFKNKTTYKIGLKHTHPSLPGLETSINYYTSYDAPTIYQYAPSAYVQFNPNLKPSYTKGFDIRASYKKLISITYFSNKVEDYIDYVSDPVTFLGGYENVAGTSKFKGFEIEGAYTFTPYNLMISANYTHLLKAEKYDKRTYIRRPKDTLNANVDYYTQNNMHFGIKAQYIGDRIDTDFSTFPSSQVQTGKYTLWNIHFDTKIMDDIDVAIHAKNIFDKDYQSVYGYATAGRTIDVKVKYSF